MYVIKENPNQVALYDVFHQESGECVLSYLYCKGSPKNYIANCSKGKIQQDEKIIGTSLEIQPLSWRFFSDSLFNDKKDGIVREWVELFFIDNKNCLSVISFHKYSAQNLAQKMSKLIYEKAHLGQCKLRISFKEKYAKSNNSKYYIADFEIEKQDNDLPEIAKAIAQYTPIYRAMTLQETAVFTATHLYPVEMLIKHPELDSGECECEPAPEP